MRNAATLTASSSAKKRSSLLNCKAREGPRDSTLKRGTNKATSSEAAAKFLSNFSPFPLLNAAAAAPPCAFLPGHRALRCRVSCLFAKALSLCQHDEAGVAAAAAADEGDRPLPCEAAASASPPSKILLSYTRRNLIRVYPRGTRLLSSNMDPLPFWRSGCQMVALNYQAKDRPLLLNRALFRQNGRCGYVLKPKDFCGKRREDASDFRPGGFASLIGVKLQRPVQRRRRPPTRPSRARAPAPAVARC